MRLRKSFVVLALLLPTSALAADPTAEQLYQEGREAARVKNWAVACARFRASHDREPAPGTLLNLADCEDHQGKLLDALGHFEAAGRLFKPGDERVGYARQRATAITSKLPKLTVRLDSSSGTTVELDGAAMTTFNSAAPVDPGEHVLVVHAPQRAPVRSAIRLAEGESRVIDLAAGPPEALQAEAAPASRPESAVSSPPAAPAPEPASTSSSLRSVAYASLGVGAAGLVVGVLGGVLTLNAKSTADSNCPPTGCNQDGLDAESRGKTWSTIATAGFVIGAAGLATGAALLWFAPSAKTSGRVVAQPVAGGGELRWVGSF